MAEPLRFGLSDRLKKVLETYNIDGDVGVEDLAQDAARPAKAWLGAEFEDALRAGAFTTKTWGDICYNGGLDEDKTNIMDRDLRLFWAAIHPNRLYRLDEREQLLRDRLLVFWSA